MTAVRKSTLTFTLVLLFAFSGAVLLLRQLDRMRVGATIQEVLYVPSPKVLKGLSLGYNGLVADIYWTRAVQYFGSKHYKGARDYRLLAPLLDITTALDPHLIVAYQFGSIFLSQRPPNGAGQPDKAAELVERGIRENPQEWRLYYNLGFIHYLERRDYAAAADAFERGAQVKGAPPGLKVMAAAMWQHANEIQTARFLWTQIYQTTEDKMLRDNAVKRLRGLQVDDDVIHLDELVQAYRQRTGELPRSWFDLVGAGLLRGVPVDPTGRPYKLLADGRIEVQSSEDLPFITKGLPPGKAAETAIP